MDIFLFNLKFQGNVADYLLFRTYVNIPNLHLAEPIL